MRSGKCPFVVNPYLHGVIYANLKINDFKTRTFVSLDNGRNFMSIEFKRNSLECDETDCGVELDLKCSLDFMKQSFPDRWIVKFEGTFHIKGTTSRHIFISFNGGKNWKKLDSQIEKLVIVNRGGLIYDEGRKWYKINVGANKFIDLIPLAYPNNLVIATLNFDSPKNIYSLFLFNFTHILNNPCQSDGYEIWYLPRYYGHCFQGWKVSYLKKKPFEICFDDRTSIQPDIEPCPCSLEDFPCKPNYYSEDNFCVRDPVSKLDNSKKTCPEGTKPLARWNGFAQLDPDSCQPRRTLLDPQSGYYDYCISENFSIRIFVFTNEELIESRLDYKGNYIPASHFKKHILPLSIDVDTPITYDIGRKSIYTYQNHTIIRFKTKNGSFSSDKFSIYLFSFDVISMEYDSLTSLLFLLDDQYRLFAVSIKENYIKLLSQNVTSFTYHTHTL
ncbi:VPS10 domain-containing receptor SorCS1 [Thelohanellus kitauei]|uniref:VPS10 domain-containing receptor SorCS1 n=1 Tax=Thelohanellus kitauei TaxID=669202 RepID=A0A0C2MJ57_THEKT|nr:VPS10 domain-containing receptor SorCS1 [Thelohanellus kitauei]